MTTFEKANVYNSTDDHITKYNKIIDFLGYQNVKAILKNHFSKETIINALKEDEHLNNIPLSKWDAIAGFKTLTYTNKQTYI